MTAKMSEVYERLEIIDNTVYEKLPRLNQVKSLGMDEWIRFSKSQGQLETMRECSQDLRERLNQFEEMIRSNERESQNEVSILEQNVMNIRLQEAVTETAEILQMTAAEAERALMLQTALLQTSEQSATSVPIEHPGAVLAFRDRSEWGKS